MRGKYRVVVKNKRLHYEFEIKRNITIIKGDSATGKTTLINMIRQFANLGNSSGVDLISLMSVRGYGESESPSRDLPGGMP